MEQLSWFQVGVLLAGFVAGLYLSMRQNKNNSHAAAKTVAAEITAPIQENTTAMNQAIQGVTSALQFSQQLVIQQIGQVGQQDTRIKQLEASLIEVNIKNTTLTRQVEELVTDAARSTQERIAFGEQVKNLNESLAQTKDELTKAQARIKQLEDERVTVAASHDTTIKTLTDQLEAERGKVVTMQAQMDAQASRIKILEDAQQPVKAEPSTT